VADPQKPPEGARPLPIDKTGTVRNDGYPYYLDGAQVLPPTAEVTVQLGVRIVGINKASLDVQGGLKVHGTEGNWVRIEGIDFSPTREARRGLHLDMVDFRGCRFAHGENEEIGGDVTIENSCFQNDCAFDVRMRRGFLKIMTCEFGMPCRIFCDRQKENSVPIEVEIRSSWMRELELRGPGMIFVRHTELKAGVTCRSVTQVEVDGCDVRADLTIEQQPEDDFKKITLTKCNLLAGARLVLRRKPGEKTRVERLAVDKFYFETSAGPAEGEKEIGPLIEDVDDDEAGNSVRALVSKGPKRPHLLVSYDLRSRAPPLN
jgi:hypothetical protein